MDQGSIHLDTLDGGFDLQSTLESGQTYLWERDDETTYEQVGKRGSNAWYTTVVNGEVLRVRHRENRLEWEATVDATAHLTRLFRLDDDLASIINATPDDPLLDRAFESFPGMRIVRDPFFPCLISFICSAQMRVSRIFEMVSNLREEYGEIIEFNGQTYRAFPSAEQLARTSEAKLRDLGLGYRAPYVVKTAEMITSNEFSLAPFRDLEYVAARDALTAFVGVGPKVADCVCLFSLGHLEAVPLDTWIRSAIDEHYPECALDGYDQMSEAIRNRFGPHAGYAQTYVFHYLRTRTD